MSRSRPPGLRQLPGYECGHGCLGIRKYLDEVLYSIKKENLVYPG